MEMGGAGVQIWVSLIGGRYHINWGNTCPLFSNTLSILIYFTNEKKEESGVLISTIINPGLKKTSKDFKTRQVLFL